MAVDLREHSVVTLVSQPTATVVSVAEVQELIRESWAQEEAHISRCILEAQQIVMEAGDRSLLYPTRWKWQIYGRLLVKDVPYRIPRPPVQAATDIVSVKIWKDQYTVETVDPADYVLAYDRYIVFKDLPPGNIVLKSEKHLPLVAEIIYDAGHSQASEIEPAVKAAVRDVAAARALRLHLDPNAAEAYDRVLQAAMVQIRSTTL